MEISNRGWRRCQQNHPSCKERGSKWRAKTHLNGEGYQRVGSQQGTLAHWDENQPKDWQAHWDQVMSKDMKSSRWNLSTLNSNINYNT